MFFFSSSRRHTRWPRDWSSDVCSSDLLYRGQLSEAGLRGGAPVDEEGEAVVPGQRRLRELPLQFGAVGGAAGEVLHRAQVDAPGAGPLGDLIDPLGMGRVQIGRAHV